MRNRLAIFILLIFCAALLSGCLGPKPVVEGTPTVQPPQQGSDEPFRVEAIVANRGPGGGEVEVVVQLTNRDTNEVIVQDSKNVQMEKDEQQHVLFELNLPPSAKDLDPSKIQVDVEANYPIE